MTKMYILFFCYLLAMQADLFNTIIVHLHNILYMLVDVLHEDKNSTPLLIVIDMMT